MATVAEIRSQIASIESQIASVKAQKEAALAAAGDAYDKIQTLDRQFSQLRRTSRVGLSDIEVEDLRNQQNAVQIEIEDAAAEERLASDAVDKFNAQTRPLETELRTLKREEQAAMKAEVDAAVAAANATAAKATPTAADVARQSDAGTAPLSESEEANLKKDTATADDNSAVPAASNVARQTPAPEEKTSSAEAVKVSANGTNKKTVIKPNPLHDYNNYTYLVTLHLLDKNTYAQLVESTKFENGKVVFKSDNVLIASAGKYSESGTRNPEWKENFFIENLNIDTIIGMSSQTMGTNAVQIAFDIIEPMGLTLIERLIKSSLATSYKNYLEMVYALQIEFIGYDEEGNIKPLPNHTKFIPIKFAGITFKVTEQGTVYKVSATPFNHQAFNSSYATAPISLSVTAATVADYFVDYGQTDSTSTESEEPTSTARLGPPNRKPPAAPAYIEAASWCNAINKFEKRKQKTNENYIPDSYQIKFDEKIGSAKLTAITNPAATQITNTPMSVNGRRTASTDPRSTTYDANAARMLDGGKIKYEATTQQINAGTTLISEINKIVRNSEFFISQFAYTDPSALKDKSKEQLAEIANKHDKVLKWWKIIPEIKLKEFDFSRNTYAKEITYYVTSYDVPYNSFPGVPKLQSKDNQPSPVKRYDYLFTGKNNDILDFNLDFNTSYYVAYTVDTSKLTATGSSAEVTTNGASGESKQQVPVEFNKENLVNVQRQLKSGQTSAQAGATDKRDSMSVLTSDLQELLFSKPSSDLVVLDLRIVGDPDFIKQDDIFSGPNRSASALNNSLPMDTGDVYIVVAFKTPTDFDEETGLPNKSETSKFSGLYRVVSVDNSFSSGVFVQKIHAIRVFVPGDYDFDTEVTEETKPVPTAVVAPAPDNTSTSATSSSVTNLTISRNVFDLNPAGGTTNAEQAENAKLKDIANSVSSTSISSVGNINTSLYANTSNEDLTYTGDDYIVWDRINAERLRRGLPGLQSLGFPRPPLN